jgi:3-phenylpropionate/cinnamic acid dioxygenase small subunit
MGLRRITLLDQRHAGGWEHARVSDAHEVIRNLLGRYCELMDAGDWDGLADLLADAVLADFEGHEAARGRDGVLRLYRDGTITYDGSPRTRHLTANSVINVDDDAGTATARSSFVVLQAVEGFSLQPIASGRYRDRFVRRDGEWRFTERSFALDHVGDLSHHLRSAPPS